MKIIVVGCGKIGITILATLVQEGHDVTVLDNDPTVVEDISGIHDVIGVVGNAADCEVLTEANADKTDLFIAVTGSDETNMLSCFLAKQMGAKHTIARIRNPEYSDDSLRFMKDHLGISMIINPDRLSAQELFHILRLPSAAKVETFSRSNFEMMEMRLKPGSALAGLPLSELREKFKARFLVCVVQRGEEVYIPDGAFVLQAGDRIGVTASAPELSKFLKEIGLLQKQIHNVMILGGSRMAIYLAKRLIAAGMDVKIIEMDAELCEELCTALPKAVVIHADGAQQEVLLQEGIRRMDAFVSLTGMDEENILLSFFASSQDVPKTVAKITRDELNALAEKLGLECTVSPRKIVADIVLRYARALENSLDSNIETLYTLMDDRAEAAEFWVKEDSRFVGKSLKELSLKKNILIAGIIRDRRPIIPGGDDRIATDDRLVVLAAGRRLSELKDILK